MEIEPKRVPESRRTRTSDVAAYSDADAEAWDRFVREDARNGGIFHERLFLDYHPPGRFQDASLIFRSRGAVVGVLPAVRQGSRVVSHAGSSAGGLIYRQRAGLREVLGLLEGALEAYQVQGAASLELRLAEPIFSWPSDGELPYLLWHRGFTLKVREISSCVDLRQDWQAFARKKNRYDIRSIEAQGGAVGLTESVARVYGVIEESLASRYDKRATHTLAELQDLRCRFPERLHLWCAEVAGTILAVAVVFVVNRRAAHCFYLAKNYALDLHGLPFLFRSVLTHYRDLGLEWFNFGISSRGDWIKWGILGSKERLGARASFREVWELEDLQAYQALARRPE